MKKLFVGPKGNVILKEVRKPIIETEGSIVKTRYSLISPGTELRTIEVAKLLNFSLKSILKNFFKSKEFRERFFAEIKSMGIKNIIQFYKSFSKKYSKKNFRSPSINLFPLGYCCSGIIQKTNVEEYRGGGRVVCSGSKHAELIFSPKNLTCIVPDNVSLEEAAFSPLGAIALHAVHRADLRMGEYVGVIGTGLIGLLVVQLAKLNGAHVTAFDIINKRLKLAKELGADVIINPKNINSTNLVKKITKGHGFDSIIICASSNTSKPLNDALDFVKEKGKIVLLGAFPINVDRDKLYYKEADILISRSLGPGRYDKSYEYFGFDYPEEYVPWTEKRNMELILKLISEKKLKVKELITDLISVKNANLAYKKLESDPINNLAILLDFDEKHMKSEVIDEKISNKTRKSKLIIGLIGCGSFAQGTHLPILISNPNCKIKAISTNHHKTAEICKNKFKPDYITTNYKQILEDPEIQTIFIYTRHNTHAKFTIEALNAGKNVYVEKPMGINLEQCKTVLNAVKKSGKLYTLGFNRRYSPLIKIVKELLNERKNPIIINYRIANNFIPGNHWIFDPKIGGGPLIGEFCHFTDLILYLINSNPVELIAKGGNLSHVDLETYDSCTTFIKFQNGSIANIIYTDLSGPNLPKERIEIFSGESAIIIDDFKTMHTTGFDIGNKILNEQDKGHKNEIDAFIKRNLGLNIPIVNVDNAFKAMILCFKTIESIEKNKAIKFESDLFE